MMQRLKRRLACWLLPDLASMLREPHSIGDALEIRIEKDRMWINGPDGVLLRAWDMQELVIVYNGVQLHGFRFRLQGPGQGVPPAQDAPPAMMLGQHEPLRVDTPPTVWKADPWGFPCA